MGFPRLVTQSCCSIPMANGAQCGIRVPVSFFGRAPTLHNGPIACSSEPHVLGYCPVGYSRVLRNKTSARGNLLHPLLIRNALQFWTSAHYFLPGAVTFNALCHRLLRRKARDYYDTLQFDTPTKVLPFPRDVISPVPHVQPKTRTLNRFSLLRGLYNVWATYLPDARGTLLACNIIARLREFVNFWKHVERVQKRYPGQTHVCIYLHLILRHVNLSSSPPAPGLEGLC